MVAINVASMMIVPLSVSLGCCKLSALPEVIIPLLVGARLGCSFSSDALWFPYGKTAQVVGERVACKVDS